MNNLFTINKDDLDLAFKNLTPNEFYVWNYFIDLDTGLEVIVNDDVFVDKGISEQKYDDIIQSLIEKKYIKIQDGVLLVYPRPITT